MGKFYPFEVINGECYGGVGPVGGLLMDASYSDVLYPMSVVSPLSFQRSTGARFTGNGEDNPFAPRSFVTVWF